MRPWLALATLALFTLAGVWTRLLPATPAPRSVLSHAEAGERFHTNVGDLEGRLISFAGCPLPLGLALIPGHLSGLDFAALQWSRGPAVRQFWFGARPLSPTGARVVITAQQTLFFAGRAIGLSGLLPPFAVATFVPASCEAPPRAVLDRVLAAAAEPSDRS